MDITDPSLYVESNIDPFSLLNDDYIMMNLDFRQPDYMEPSDMAAVHRLSGMQFAYLSAFFHQQSPDWEMYSAIQEIMGDLKDVWQSYHFERNPCPLIRVPDYLEDDND